MAKKREAETLTPGKDFIACVPRVLTDAQRTKAIKAAQELYPHRYPAKVNPGFLAVDVQRWWGDDGGRFTVAFLDNPNAATRKLIIDHANVWNQYANVEWKETNDIHAANVRIARAGGSWGGYWSYLGTDNLGIPVNQPTMNLEGFTEHTPQSEYLRVVRHEFGHMLSFPHEHMRKQLVDLLDPAKTYAYFRRNYGWTKSEVNQQVLTPLSEKSIRGTPNADDLSIMCCDFPAEITRNGQAIRGGMDINPTDAAFIATIYPKPVVNPPVPPIDPETGEPPEHFETVVELLGAKYKMAFDKLAEDLSI